MAPPCKAEMTDYRKNKRWKRGRLVVFAGSAVAVLQMKTRKWNGKETGVSFYYVVGFVVFFSVSLLKDLVEVLLFLCGTAQLVCTWLKESHGTLYLNICAFPSPFNSVSWLLHSLGPVGDSLTSLTHDKYAPAVSSHVLIQEYKDGGATCLH